jgi:hypothetical protein
MLHNYSFQLPEDFETIAFGRTPDQIALTEAARLYLATCRLPRSLHL